MGRRLAVATGLVLLVAMAVPAWAQDVPVIPSTDLLPPVAADQPAPDVSGVCGDDGLVCVRYVEQELAGWETRFGCDHRAVFPTVYRMLTRQTRLVLEDDPGTFDDPAGLGFEALAFYELYEQMITDHLAGRPIPSAWQVTMEAAASGDWTGGHDMLLAINAHVQQDMPYAVARAGLVLPDGGSRKADHDRFNRVLAAAYAPIAQEVGRRYDPLMSDIESLPVADDVGSQQLVAGWREGVWRNAESLVTTAGTGLEAASVAVIDANATTWAEAIRTGEVPGRRALRDAHCEAYLASAPAPTEPDGPGGPDDVAPAPVPAPVATLVPTPEEPTSEALPAASADAGADLPATGGGMGVAALVALLAGVRRRRRS